MSNVAVITVDGPSGVGKGTLSSWLANKLQWNFLDSGAIYRALALYAEMNNVALEEEEKVAQLALTLPLTFKSQDNSVAIYLDQKEITHTVRQESTGNKASIIAKFGMVRNHLLARQRAFATKPGLVADGRDMGTIVFPNAPLKLFLTASSKVRAERRYKQLLENGNCVKIEQILYEVEERDRRDQSRKVAPLLPADDAIIIDTSHSNIDDVQQKAWEVIRNMKF